MLAISTSLATAYVVYLLCYFIGGTASSTGTDAVAGALATAMIAPHAIVFLIGAILGWLGFLFKQSWAALVAAILYSVGTVLFLAYFMFGVPILTLGFIGYVNQNKIGKHIKKEREAKSAE